jgi:phosphoenolpyruvate synthase/pyruvate phosphate dikinase
LAEDLEAGVVPLAEATDVTVYGSKAIGLGDAIRDGLPVPPGFALAGPVVEAVAGEDEATIERVLTALRGLRTPLAVRSSAVDEDGEGASFAGQHLTLLNVPSIDDVPAALREIWWSANSDSAITYRQRVGLFTRPSVGVVVQSLLDPVAAGVMFTQNPVTGADERVIEAAWGLGEAVVAGLVIPDTYRLGRGGETIESVPGLKRTAVRCRADGGTYEEEIDAVRAEALTLDDDLLAQLSHLAQHCEEVYGNARDIEWAVDDGTVYLLQCRAVTTTAAKSSAIDPTAAVPENDPTDVLTAVPLFAGLSDDDVDRIAALCKARRFAPGDVVIREGSGGASFYVIDSGEATVTIRGDEVASLGPGDHFGEIALIDGGQRLATVTATTDLVCHGLTYWEFRPLVQENGALAWKLLQTMARMLRAAEETPAEPPAAAG